MIIDVVISGQRSKMRRNKELVEKLLNENLPFAEINVETYPSEKSETTTGLFNQMTGKPTEVFDSILEAMKPRGCKK